MDANDCDICDLIHNDDTDGDGVCGDIVQLRSTANSDQMDTDGDDRG